jgi:hypothetical protein
MITKYTTGTTYKDEPRDCPKTKSTGGCVTGGPEGQFLCANLVPTDDPCPDANYQQWVKQ